MSRVVVITGASSGIGLTTANFFHSKGDVVYGLSRRQLNAEFNEIKCDITNENEVKLCVEKIIEQEGKIDVVVNNAGMGISGPVETTKIDDARKLFEVNFFGSLNVINAILPYMRKARSGKIINISSVASPLSIPFQSFYSASKAAIDSLTFALRAEVIDFNIKVCSVLPGDTKTSFTQNREKQNFENAGEYAEKMQRSVSQMEKDEQGGMNSICVAKLVYKLSNKKNPPVHAVVGFKYKLLVLLSRFLPKRLVNSVIKGMYAK